MLSHRKEFLLCYRRLENEVRIPSLQIRSPLAPMFLTVRGTGTMPSRRYAVPSAVRSTGLLIVPSSACSYPARQDGHLATGTTRRHPPWPPALQNPWTAERAASMPPYYVLDYCMTVSMAPPLTSSCISGSVQALHGFCLMPCPSV
ncbi:hypothetical protein V8C26DRAFT_388719 [Trichoderma gracile]